MCCLVRQVQTLAAGRSRLLKGRESEKELLCPSCRVPLLLGLLFTLRLGPVDAGRADGRGHEHAGRWQVDRAAGRVRPGRGGAAANAGGAEALAERVLAVLLAQVAAPPDAGADPDARDADHHDDQEYDPLPVI